MITINWGLPVQKHADMLSRARLSRLFSFSGVAVATNVKEKSREFVLGNIVAAYGQTDPSTIKVTTRTEIRQGEKQWMY